MSKEMEISVRYIRYEEGLVLARQLFLESE